VTPRVGLSVPLDALEIDILKLPAHRTHYDKPYLLTIRARSLNSFRCVDNPDKEGKQKSKQ